MARKLRIAVSVCFGVLTVALVVLWVRSYWRRDEMNFRYWPTCVVEFVSMGNRLELIYGYPINDWPQRLNSHTHDEWKSVLLKEQKGFNGITIGPPTRMAVPHIAAILVAAAITAALWMPFSIHFSLRTLLIGMTLVAVVLGLLVWMVR